MSNFADPSAVMASLTPDTAQPADPSVDPERPGFVVIDTKWGTRVLTTTGQWREGFIPDDVAVFETADDAGRIAAADAFADLTVRVVPIAKVIETTLDSLSGEPQRFLKVR